MASCRWSTAMWRSTRCAAGRLSRPRRSFSIWRGICPVSRVLLLGEVEGVYDPTGQVIPKITPATLPAVEAALGGSAGTDVTGGMETKVRDMVALVEAVPDLTIRIMSGSQPGLLEATLLDQAAAGYSNRRAHNYRLSRYKRVHTGRRRG